MATRKAKAEAAVEPKALESESTESTTLTPQAQASREQAIEQYYEYLEGLDPAFAGVTGIEIFMKDRASVEELQEEFEDLLSFNVLKDFEVHFEKDPGAYGAYRNKERVFSEVNMGNINGKLGGIDENDCRLSVVHKPTRLALTGSVPKAPANAAKWFRSVLEQLIRVWLKAEFKRLRA